jgi:hypothetical protein
MPGRITRRRKQIQVSSFIKHQQRRTCASIKISGQEIQKKRNVPGLCPACSIDVRWFYSFLLFLCWKKKTKQSTVATDGDDCGKFGDRIK